VITQRDELLRRAARRGWDVAAFEDAPTEWWADTIVTLESTWSPQGRRIVLVFLVDPQHDGPRRPREHVWAIMASSDRPKSREETLGRPTLSLRNWSDGLDQFLANLDALRSS